MTAVWIQGGADDRLEREIFGDVPFDQVPESPYYQPSPGSWLSARAWLDSDSQHVVVAHDCRLERRTSMLPWPTWQANGSKVTPSVSCDDCGLHTFVTIEWREVAAS